MWEIQFQIHNGPSNLLPLVLNGPIVKPKLTSASELVGCGVSRDHSHDPNYKNEMVDSNGGDKLIRRPLACPEAPIPHREMLMDDECSQLNGGGSILGKYIPPPVGKRCVPEGYQPDMLLAATRMRAFVRSTRLSVSFEIFSRPPQAPPVTSNTSLLQRWKGRPISPNQQPVVTHLVSNTLSTGSHLYNNNERFFIMFSDTSNGGTCKGLPCGC